MRGSSEMRALFTFEQIFSDSCEWWLLFTLCHCFTMWTPHTTWFTYHWFTYHTGSHTTLVHIPHGSQSHTTGVRFPTLGRGTHPQPWTINQNFAHLTFFLWKSKQKQSTQTDFMQLEESQNVPEFKGFSTYERGHGSGRIFCAIFWQMGMRRR